MGKMKWKICCMLVGIVSLLALLCCCAEKPGTEEEKTLKELDGYGLEGYVGENLVHNIQNWQITALRNNPNIVDLIAQAGKNLAPLSAVMAGGTSGTEYVIAESGGYSGKALAFRQLKEKAAYGDVDFRFWNDPTSRIDWSGAKELWVYVNVSDFGSQAVPVGLSFEEYNLDAAGDVTTDRESWRLKDGAIGYLLADGSEEWEAASVVHSRLVLPAGFRGWVRVSLDTDTYTPYWASNTYNHVIDLKHVHQFQLCVTGNATAAGKTAYLDSFAIAGDVHGTDFPAKASGTASGDTFQTVWTMEGMSDSNISYTGTIVPWYGEFAGKLLTGIAYHYQLTRDSDLLQAGNALAEALKDAQGEDGYLGVFSGESRMGGKGANWDVWGHYHCIMGLTKWHQIAGNEEALQTAIQALDYVYDYFVGAGRTFDSAGEQTMNLAICHAFALLYQETGTQRYLDAAQLIVEEDWPRSGDWLNSLLKGKDYYQTALPRWESLHAVSSLAALYEITEEQRYYQGLEAAWWSIVKTDRHNDGGFSTGEGAIGTPYQDTGIETCCTVAWMALSTEYLRVSKNSYVADELELSFFNAMLGSLLADDKYTTYNTPMNGQRVPSQETLAFQFNSGSPDFNCCQANLARGLGEVSQWAVLCDQENVYLNYYGASSIKTQTPSGADLGILQQTEYPRNGSIRIQLLLDQEETFRFRLRIPFWSANTKVTVNGKRVANVSAGEYLMLEQAWKNGDVIQVELDLSLHYWVGEEEQQGKTSIYCGPILLALDPAFCDLPAETILNPESLQANLQIGGTTTEDAWLFYDTETADGRPIRLVDFASAGKQERAVYHSWLMVDSSMEPLAFEKDRVVVWNNKP